MNEPNGADSALLAVLDALASRGYRFTTVTPATHAKVLARDPGREGRTLADVFGWSLPFSRDAIDADLFRLLEQSDALIGENGNRFRSRYRVSTHDGLYLLHSSYPTTAEDAVFFGPDSMRFAAVIAQHLPDLPPGARIADYGTGTGVGGLVAARAAGRKVDLALCDINPAALRLAATNAAHAGIAAQLLRLASPGDLPEGLDLVVTHPPFMMDDRKRTYRDGGDMLGARLSYDWAMAAAERLAPGGHVIMHTGTSIAAGTDLLKDALTDATATRGWSLDYREVEQDYYAEELDTPAYRDAGVERIAMVAAVIGKPA
ncbi:methyltransferase [Qipengyuania sediminis]|uniref:methyltransferase n=1 Tax=Qipengyuania sediminis TaxID=1532023 RepID=UPI00105A2064|nr:methyltransferase [Qipengyuania sediminis]